MQYRDPKSGETFIRKLRRDSSEPNGVYELTFSCFRRFRFLDRNRTREWLVDSLQDARRKLSFELWAWVIMPEHVHLLLRTREDESTVGRIRSAVKEPVARKAIRFLEENAPDWLPRITVTEGTQTRRRFWQPGGGYDRNVIEPNTAHTMIDYIHHNPVRRGLVEKATDWEWSSARWYAGIFPAKIEMDRTLPERLN